MIPSNCWYFGKVQTLPELVVVLENFFRGGWDKLIPKGIDGWNITDDFFDPKNEVVWSTGGAGGGGGSGGPGGPGGGGGGGGSGGGGGAGGGYLKRRRVYIPILDRTGHGGPAVRRKGASTTTGNYVGIEVLVDTTDTTNGRFCIIDKKDLRQLISFIPDTATNTNPGGTIRTPLGALTLDTGGAFDLIFGRNGTEQARFNGTQLLFLAGITAVVSANATRSGLNVGQGANTPTTIKAGDLWGGADSLPRYAKLDGTGIVIETQDNKNAANGYIGADAGGQVATARIADAAVTLAKMANLATQTVIGRNTDLTGAPEALTRIPTGTVPAFTGGNVTSAGGSLVLNADGNSAALQLKRGVIASLPAALNAGEIYAPSDSPELVIGL